MPSILAFYTVNGNRRNPFIFLHRFAALFTHSQMICPPSVVNPVIVFVMTLLSIFVHHEW